MEGHPYVQIRDLRPGMKSLNVIFIVLDIGKPTRTKDGHDVRSCKVSDKSGSVNVSVWDEAGCLLQTGDICKLTKGYSSLWKGCLTLYTGKNGEITKIGEFTMLFCELPNMSEVNQDFKDPSGQRKSPPSENPDNGSHPINQSGPNQSMMCRPSQPGGQITVTTGNGQMSSGNYNNRLPRPNMSQGGAVNGRGRAVRR